MDECEERMISAIFGHINMVATGVLEVLGDIEMLPTILRPALKKQFPLLLKIHNAEEPKSIEEVIEFINSHSEGCRLKLVDMPVEEDYDVVAIVEDEILLDRCLKRARENFGAKTSISECMLILLSWSSLSDEYDLLFRTYEKDGFIRVRGLIVRS